ncbi:hypothetical protein B296_00051272 [Ensete ventricosum]|uniref:ApaG domain-containing protein n=1 Tax=Ensete ventricosum TaxID=4639 RepID=A0A426YHJ0_ENSVE|nr:hypothetical protein B296_00051272 [Ensete ventricosum]
MIQSLVSLKLLPGLNPATKTTSGRGWPTRNVVERGGGGIGTRRRCANVREAKATSSSLPTPPDSDRDRDGKVEGEEGASSAAASFLFRSQTYAMLKQQMAVAAKFEVGVASPAFFFFLSLYPGNLFGISYRVLVSYWFCQDYKEAARIRDSLKFFEEEEPALHLRKLMRKAVEDERFELLQGAGVIGEQPVILPRTGFEYSSACPLSTPSGRMFHLRAQEGDFEMKRIDTVGSPTFNVAIAPFSLSIMGDDTDGLL